MFSFCASPARVAHVAIAMNGCKSCEAFTQPATLSADWDDGDCGKDKTLDFKLCDPDWVGNNRCDEVCNNEEYKWDGLDCLEKTDTSKLHAVLSCPKSLDDYIIKKRIVANKMDVAFQSKVQDLDAAARHCLLSGGTCSGSSEMCRGALKGPCTHGCGCCYNVTCKDEWRGDGSCDAECNIKAHGFDGGDCAGADPVFAKCAPSWLGDGTCHDECNNEENGWDCNAAKTVCDCEKKNVDADGDGVFDKPITLFGTTICPASWLGNGQCDALCNTTAQRYACSSLCSACVQFEMTPLRLTLHSFHRTVFESQ